LEYCKVRRAEEQRNINNIKNERDPRRLYNSNLVDEKQLSPTAEIGMSKGTTNLPNNVDLNKKYPMLVKDAIVTLVRDQKLFEMAGGYDENKIYEDLAKYAKVGLYLD
jgi:hypothetical protein